MVLINKIKNLFKSKNDYEQLKSKRTKNLPNLKLKEPIQTYNRKDNKWSKMFYRDYSKSNVVGTYLNKRG